MLPVDVLGPGDEAGPLMLPGAERATAGPIPPPAVPALGGHRRRLDLEHDLPVTVQTVACGYRLLAGVAHRRQVLPAWLGVVVGPVEQQPRHGAPLVSDAMNRSTRLRSAS